MKFFTSYLLSNNIFRALIKHLLLIIVTIVFQKAFASSSDSIVKFTDLTFKNETERSAFSQFVLTKDSMNVIDLFLTPYDRDKGFSSIKAQQRISDCINFLSQEIRDKSESKKAKTVYTYVHKSFLKVYKLKNSFADIFEKGEYNCVSATALYAIVFSRLDIPYQIKETPEHVYLIAYPHSYKILIETTAPERGYYRFNDDFVKKYINSLLSSKMLSKQELDTTEINTLFNRYYFSSETISLIQLAGLQYNNYGVYHLEDKNYEIAISELKKAYFLYACQRTKFLLKSSLIYQLSNQDYIDEKQIHNLALICRYNNLKDDEISNEVIKVEFSRIIQTQLINNSDYNQFDSSYAIISTALTDTVLIKDIGFNYHLELARLGYINLKEPEYELKHLVAAYRINPRNANLQAIILAYFDRMVQKGNDAKFIINTMNEYSNKFDFLNENIQFNNVKSIYLLELAFNNFSMNDLNAGEYCLKEFEKLYKTKKMNNTNSVFIEKAYSVAAAAYYKKENYTRSKQLLKTGLQYAPDSFGLKQRLNQF